MKTLLRKELRETLKPGIIAFLVFAALVLQTGRDYAEFMADLSQRTTPASLNMGQLQPLRSASFGAAVGWLCALFGAFLGGWQIFIESPRDLWAFLVHRPISRTHIFLSKVAAGFVTYALAVGLPLGAFILWTALPGRVAAPFDSDRAASFGCYWLAGLLFYFATMLTTLRQARWYGSRALSIAAAFTAALPLYAAIGGQRDLLCPILALALLALAAWGSFLTYGAYQGQPKTGKLALAISFSLGGAALTFLSANLIIASLLPEPLRDFSGRKSFYIINRDGSVLKRTSGGGHPIETTDLEGKLVANPLEPYSSTHLELNAPPTPAPSRNKSWQETPYFWTGTNNVLWYTQNRRFVAYDVAARRLLGSLGPEGFTSAPATVKDRFTSIPYRNGMVSSATNLYKPDLAHKTLRLLFSTPADEPILGWVPSSTNYLVVGTARSLYLLTPDGTQLWQAHRPTTSATYNAIRIFQLTNEAQIALLSEPGYNASEQADWKLPSYVLWANDKGVIKSMELPPTPAPENLYSRPPERIIAALTSPALVLAWPWFIPLDPPWQSVILAVLTGALVCLPIGWWLGRRYHFTPRSQVGWALFHVLFAVPGLLAFLSIHEWPARVACPACKRTRVVNNEICEHCGAPFPPAEKNGTEILKPSCSR